MERGEPGADAQAPLKRRLELGQGAVRGRRDQLSELGFVRLQQPPAMAAEARRGGQPLDDGIADRTARSPGRIAPGTRRFMNDTYELPEASSERNLYSLSESVSPPRPQSAEVLAR